MRLLHRLRDQAYDWLAWAILASIPAAILQQSATSLAEQDAASGGPMRNAALFPRAIAVIMIGLLAWQATRLLTGRVAAASPMVRQEGTPRALAASALFAAYLIALPVVGFHLATPVLGAILFALLGVRLLPALAGGIALSLAVAFVFEGLLNVVLPVGRLGIAIFA